MVTLLVYIVVVNSEILIPLYEERSFLSKRLETFYDLCTKFHLISQSQTILNSTHIIMPDRNFSVFKEDTFQFVTPHQFG